jgi:hypothetical protein
MSYIIYLTFVDLALSDNNSNTLVSANQKQTNIRNEMFVYLKRKS